MAEEKVDDEYVGHGQHGFDPIEGYSHYYLMAGSGPDSATGITDRYAACRNASGSVSASSVP